MPELDERIAQWFLRRTRSSDTGKILVKGLMGKLCTEVMNDQVAIRKSLARLRDDGRIDFTPDERGNPVSSFVTVAKIPEVEPPHRTRWASTLAAAGLAAPDIAALASLADTVADLHTDDMDRLLAGLLKLRMDCDALALRPAFLVSAEYLLGSSKILGSLPKRAMKAFGVDLSQFTNHPPYVVVAGCSAPEAVVLVENPAAFERAVATAAVRRCAFIATFGFGLSNSEDDYGKQLAGIVESRFQQAVTLRREGSTCPDVQALLTHTNITFWGDLDLAGISIYMRLRNALPALQVSRLYEPMVRSISNPGRSHPYVASVGKANQVQMARSSAMGLSLVSSLLAVCCTRAVDQEQVTNEEIEEFAPYALADVGLTSRR